MSYQHVGRGIPGTDEAASGPPVRRDVPRDRATAGWSRRSFMQLAAAAGAGVGLAVLGVFPVVRRARADGYEIKDLPCPGYASGHNCSPGCGDSDVCGGGSDGPCCENGSGYWHLSGAQSNDQYRLRMNECVTGTGWDGWKWDPGACGACSSVIYRCHDGKKRQSDGSYKPDICRHAVYCAA